MRLLRPGAATKSRLEADAKAKASADEEKLLGRFFGDRDSEKETVASAFDNTTPRGQGAGEEGRCAAHRPCRAASRVKEPLRSPSTTLGPSPREGTEEESEEEAGEEEEQGEGEEEGDAEAAAEEAEKGEEPSELAADESGEPMRLPRPRAPSMSYTRTAS